MSNDTDIKSYNKGLKSTIIPASAARFPWVSTPQTKFKPEGVFKVEQRLDPKNPKHAAFIEMVEKIVADGVRVLGARKAKKMNSPLKEEFERDADGKDTDTPSGYILASASTSAKTRDGTAKELPVVDGRKRPVTKPVYGGSTLVCAVKPSLYDTGTQCGVKLYLNAVQVLELVSAGSGGVNQFDVDEDAYVDDGETSATRTASAGDDDAPTDDGSADY